MVGRALDWLEDRSRVRCAWPADLPGALADPGLLERVVANLVGNAVRHAPEGPVTVRAGALGDRVEVRVADRGPGVPPADRERVFAPFQRLGDAPRGQGVGLGLAVARGLTEAMGGSLTAEDTRGRADDGRLPAGGRSPVAGARVSRVLVVADDPQPARALRITLRAAGHEVVVAPDGRAALREAASAHPDVVVLDLGLPDLDGTEVLAGLRPWFAGPVLVLPARADSTDKVRALDAGADDYVTKPFDMGELLARLRALLRRGPGGPDEPVVVTDAFTVDLAARQVTIDGVAVRLTPTEWELVRAPGRLVGQRELLRAVWGPAYEKETHYLRVYLAQLRRKLEPDPAHPRYLRTEPGMGYRITP